MIFCGLYFKTNLRNKKTTTAKNKKIIVIKVSIASGP